MAEDRIIVDGRSYISSVRAAQLFGYTKDYVGQLARAGKIQSQIIGRSWYVDEDSIRQHKLTVHYTLTKPKKPRKSVEQGNSGTRYGNAEKPIEEVDISDAIRMLSDAPAQLHSEKEVYQAEKKSYSPPREEYDLFPKPVKPTSFDALAKSDFMYESNPPLAYVADTAGLTTEHANRGAVRPNFDGITIRTSTPSMRDRRDRFATTSRTDDGRSKVQATKHPGPIPRALMDGIVTSPEPRPLGYSEDEELDTDNGNERLSPRVRARFDMHDEERPSRILPILGALIIFLVLTIVYLVS